MNLQESDVLNALLCEPFINKKNLSEVCGYSLAVINRIIKSLISQGYLDEKISPTHRAYEEFKSKAPKNAVILAAGFGLRMVPINFDSPKPLLKVNGQPLIERLIEQLQGVGISDIYIVVGFMKEKFEYLKSKYGVNLVVNADYSKKNNLHSLNLVSEHISNTYIVPGDIWCAKNPFNRYELYSWYMMSDVVDNESPVKINQKKELILSLDKLEGNAVIGISYLLEEQCTIIRKKLHLFDSNIKYDNSFWETTLYDNGHMIVQARIVHSTDVVEINTYEQLRELDGESDHLKSDAISIICQTMKAIPTEISHIKVLKKGMTNRSFMFDCKGKKYIMRIPGEGTDQLINRKEEAEVYETINGKDICDDVIYINHDNGYKITEYIEETRVCNPNNLLDIKACMKKLKEFHSLKLTVGHEFDVFGQIEFYETLWDGNLSIYSDYFITKQNVFSLKKYIDAYTTEKCLAHIDAIPDNFLIMKNGEIRLIDWEYAGMQDPHIDIAMFCIYSLYNKFQVDRLIDIYFEGNCPDEIKIKIYCYIAVCGLLWSNWCEYKRKLGVEFGEYSLRQYQYAKEYYKLVEEKIGKVK